MRHTRRHFPWPVIAMVALAAGWLGSAGEFGKRLDYELADAGARLLLHQIESDVVIIGIDARSLSELHEWPWPRGHHAALIEKLAPASPKRLFVDIDFSSPSNPEDDRLLESALARWNGAPVILPAFYQPATATDDELLLTMPLMRLRQHVSVASVNLRPSVDGLVRSIPAAWTFKSQTIPSVASLLRGAPAATDEEIKLDFTIDPASFHYVSYSDVLADRVPAEYFADKTIFVGATAVELGDNVAVPLHRSLPGVAVLALAYESVRDGPYASLPTPVYWSLVAVCSLVLAFLFCRQSWRQNIFIGFGSFTIGAAMSLLLYSAFDTVVELVPFLLTVMTAYLLSTLRTLEGQTLRALAFAIGLRKRDALLKSIVLSSTDCIVCMDASGSIQTANPAAAKLFSCEPGRLAGCSILTFIPSLLHEQAELPLLRLEQMSGSLFESTARREDGETFPVEMSISRVKLKDEQLYTAIIRDISERKAQQRQLQFQATHDPLTALPNRPALAARLDSMLANAGPTNSVALMMIDLDRFKEVNDTLGHNVGDYVLYEVARRLERIVLERGFIARIGGDEFALVVDRSNDLAEIARLSRELVDCMKKPIETCGVAIDVGLSIGIAVCPQDAADAESLFKNADVAMYVAKRSRSGFEYYNAASDRHSVRKLTTVTRLRKAIADDELKLCFQPQVNLKTGRVESVEALLRWEDASLGRVSPDEFIALAETTDLIQPLSEWTLRKAFMQSALWHAEGIELRVAINLSARVLQDAGFPARLAGMMRETGVSPEHFELEITESAMMIDPKRALSVIGKLSGLGVQISIDDYGTGFSSLAYLRDLPVHALKLDKSFVMNMQHHDDRVIVESTVQLAHALNLQVIAEGVETEADAAFLKACGYDYGQGYLYSVALEPDALLRWIRRYDTSMLGEYRRNSARQLCLH
jgi:diguanylate cyclase (GGDEF)-like protein/PAS domain S-box-containing protein